MTSFFPLFVLPLAIVASILNIFFFFFLRFFFDVGSFLKSLLYMLHYCFCFMFWFFDHKACGILAPQPWIEPAPPTLDSEVLTTGPPREVPHKAFDLACLLFLLLGPLLFKIFAWLALSCDSGVKSLSLAILSYLIFLLSEIILSIFCLHQYCFA